MDPVDRLEILARRARWLERYRRLIAIGCALGVGAGFVVRVDGFLGSDWPGVHATALTGVVAVFAWWVIEVSLAWVTALWETEHYRLLRERGLPRAQLLVSRK